MGAPLVSIFEKPEYLKFIVRYRHKFLKFLIEISGKKISWQQRELAKALSGQKFSVSCVSGHGTGKSFLFAWFIMFNVTVYPYSNLLLTGNTITQLRKVVWKELADGLERLFMVFPFLEGHFVKEAKLFYAIGYKDSWFAVPGTAPKNEPENLAGFHRDRYVVLIDEASKIPDDVIGVLEGALTGIDNSIALISQGTRPNGHFYDTHHSLKHLYKTLSFDSELSPLVNEDWVEKQLLKYGGFHAAEYQIKVKGAFPDQLEGRLIARSWAEQCGLEKIEHLESPGVLIVADISGYGHDKTVYLVAEVSGYDEQRRLNTLELVVYSGISKAPEVERQIEAIYKKWEHLNPTLGVDFQGIGQTIYDHLIEDGFPCERIISGQPAIYKDRFLNFRAEWAWWTREACFNNRMSFYGVSRIVQQKIYDEFGNIPYKLTEKGVMKLWSKEQMMNIEGIRSPDIFDVYSYAMGMDYIAISTGDSVSDHFATTRAKGNAALADIQKQMEEAGI